MMRKIKWVRNWRDFSRGEMKPSDRIKMASSLSLELITFGVISPATVDPFKSLLLIRPGH